MNIVVIGAGEVGCYIASVLSKEEHNVILVDRDGKKLEQLSWNIDVAVREGSGTDWQLLDDLLELTPHLLIALTNDDETNLVACSIGKHLGYPRTIARVKDNRYLNRARLDFAHIFDVDSFIGPELLVANEILKYMLSPASLIMESFAHGAVQLRTISIPPNWKKSDVPLSKLQLPSEMICGLIHRKVVGRENEWQLYFPHGDDHIVAGDEVTFIGETEAISNVHEFFEIHQEKKKSVVIAGGSLTALNLALLLQNKKIGVRIIEKSYEKCTFLADRLPHCTIINHDATDLDFLRSEKIGYAELLVSCTHHDSVNILTALLAKEIGCEDAIVMLNDTNYIPFLTKLGISYTVSPRISAANHILSQILTGTVSSLISLYDNQAEVMEINVSLDSKVVGIPLSDLGPLMPRDFLIAMIQNRGRIMIARGDRIISPGDTVIVITNPKHIPELRKIF